MDSRGNIHYFSADPEGTQGAALAHMGGPRFTEERIKAQLERQVGPVVDIPPKQLEALQNAPRSVRRAWYSDYRRALKRAKKTGRPVEVPEL